MGRRKQIVDGVVGFDFRQDQDFLVEECRQLFIPVVNWLGHGAEHFCPVPRLIMGLPPCLHDMLIN